MSNKFKVGDEVVRTGGLDCRNVELGKKYTVDVVDGSTSIRLKGIQGCWCSEYFTLAPTFKNMYFKVESPEHSRAIQSWLFEQGYKWIYTGKKVENYSNTTFYTERDGTICNGATNLGKGTYQEHTLSYEVETKYKITDVSPVEKKELVELNGKMYDKEVLEKALSGLEEAEE